jgi:hypothetical protein
LADEVAYNAADLDDAYEAGLLRPERHCRRRSRLRGILEAVETSFPGATERERFQESVRHLTDGLVSGLIEGTVACARASGAPMWRPSAISRRGSSGSADGRGHQQQIKQGFCTDHVYCPPNWRKTGGRSMERLALSVRASDGAPGS